MKAVRRYFPLVSALFASALSFSALLAACHFSPATNNDAAMPAALGGGQWLLTEIAGQRVAAPAERTPYLVFGEDNSLSGSGGCNRLRGEYRLDAGRLHISRLVSTRMACIDMKMEAALLTALPTVTACILSGGGNTLSLLGENGATLAVLTRDKAP